MVLLFPNSQVLKNVRPRAFRLSLEDVRVFAPSAEGVAYVTCVEVIDADDSQGRCVGAEVLFLPWGASDS